MNVLLCITNQLYTQSEWTLLPVGTAYISSYLKSKGHNVHTVNFITENRSVESALSDIIMGNDIEVIGCGDLVLQHAQIKKIVNIAKKIKPSIHTIIGGGFVTFSPEDAMTIAVEADFGVIGEGELIVAELLDVLEHGGDPLRVKGLIVKNRSENSLVRTGERMDISDLDLLPFPDYEGFFTEIINKNRSASIVCSRSCPYNCRFCSHSGGKTYRQRSLGSIFDELDYLVNRYRISYLCLTDELFSINKKRILAFCARIAPYKIKWQVSLRLNDTMTCEVFTEMKQAGCIRVGFGLESADDRILKCMNKKTSVELMEKVLTNAEKANMEVTGNFIFGMEEETWETAMNTLRWAKEHRDIIPFPNYDMIRLFPGSQIYQKAIANGVLPDSVKHIENDCIPINISKMTGQEYNTFFEEILIEEDGRQYADSDWSGEAIIKGNKNNMSYTCHIRCRKCGKDHILNAPLIDNRVVWLPSEAMETDIYDSLCPHLQNYFWRRVRAEHSRWIGEKLATFLRENPHSAIWGAGRIYRRMKGQCPSLGDKGLEYILIDKNPALQKRMAIDKKIDAPEILDSGGITTVIVSTVQYQTQITEEIQKAHPEITVLGLYSDIGFT